MQQPQNEIAQAESLLAFHKTRRQSILRDRVILAGRLQQSNNVFTKVSLWFRLKDAQKRLKDNSRQIKDANNEIEQLQGLLISIE